MIKSDSIKQLAIGLLKAQMEIESAHKNSKNPFFKSNYADLGEVINAVKEPLNKNGIVFLQAVNEGPVIETILLHESGEYISSQTPVYCSKPNDPQALGSGITYSKRYALQAILGLQTEDDDGEGAMGRGKKQAEPTAKEKETLEAISDKTGMTYKDVKDICWKVGKCRYPAPDKIEATVSYINEKVLGAK